MLGWSVAAVGWLIAFGLAYAARRTFGNYDRHWRCDNCGASLETDGRVPPVLISRERKALSVVCDRCGDSL